MPSLMREAREDIRYSMTPLPGINGSGSYDCSDGYSMCGLADAHADQRYHAYQDGLFKIRAAKILGS